MNAYVTLVASDSYAAGALVLARRLRELTPVIDIVCMVTPNISTAIRTLLGAVCIVIEVDAIQPNYAGSSSVSGGVENGIKITKIQCWRLTQYSKIVFLDADTYPLRNIDELFERPSFSAAPDVRWPDSFNPGVFVTEPSEGTFDGLYKLSQNKGSAEGGDRGLLNTYFSPWPTSGDHRLPFIYNTTPTVQYSYAPAYNEFDHSIAVMHFIGQNKPWKYQRFADGQVLPLGSTWNSAKTTIQQWWGTWDKYYRNTTPYQLLSGDSAHPSHDTGFQTRPIVPFDHPIKNAWSDINVDQLQESANPMPPLEKITMGHPDWLSEQLNLEPQNNPVDTNDHAQGQNPYDNHHQEQQHHEHQQQQPSDNHDSQQNDSHADESHQEEGITEKEGHDYNEATTHNEEEHHDEQHEEHHDEQHEEHKGESSKQEDQLPYTMINWDPACQSPPKTGYVTADIPDLSYFKNVWDQPLGEQESVWIAPEFSVEPKIMANPEYSQYFMENYDEDEKFSDEVDNSDDPTDEVPSLNYICFPWERNANHFPAPTRTWQDEEYLEKNAARTFS